MVQKPDFGEKGGLPGYVWDISEALLGKTGSKKKRTTENFVPTE